MGTEFLGGIIAALVGVVPMWLTARAKRAGDKDTRDISWFDRLTARVDAQGTQIAALQKELEEVKLDRLTLRALVQAFVEHVAQWRRLLPRAQWPEAPQEVAERMGDEID